MVAPVRPDIAGPKADGLLYIVKVSLKFGLSFGSCGMVTDAVDDASPKEELNFSPSLPNQPPAFVIPVES